MFKQEAQLLLGWTAFFVTFKWRLKVTQDQRSWRTFTKWAMVNIFVNRHQRPIGATVKTPCSIFTFVILKWRRQGHPGSNFITDSESLKSTSHKCFIVTTCLSRTIKKILAIFTVVTFKWPLKVIQGQRSWCTFTKWAMVNILVYRHHGPRSNR